MEPKQIRGSDLFKKNPDGSYSVGCKILAGPRLLTPGYLLDKNLKLSPNSESTYTISELLGMILFGDYDQSTDTFHFTLAGNA
jgi:hypothetical protein